MNIGIVFSDLDGTFVREDKSISSAHWQILERLHSQNIPFVPCTGRNLCGINQELLNNPAIDYAVCANGASVVDVHTKKSIHHVPIGWERVIGLYKSLSDLPITFDAFVDGAIYMERKRYETLDTYDIDAYNLQLIKIMRTPFDGTIPDLAQKFKTCDRITCIWKRPEDRDRIIACVEATSSLTWTTSGKTNIEISDAQATKGTALTWLCDYLNIDVRTSCAFGDSCNDIQMMKAAGIAVAMQNGNDELKQHCSYIAPSNNDDGVAVWLAQHL